MKRELLILIMIVSLLYSCEKKNLPDPGGTSVQNMANEWWVTYTVNGSDVLNVGHVQIATYNSSTNNNELWLDDMGNGAEGYNFKVKVTADMNNFTFTATNAANTRYVQGSVNPQTVTITNGKILLGMAHSKSGNVTDSIYMQAQVGNSTFIISGYARTRWPEDDY